MKSKAATEAVEWNAAARDAFYGILAEGSLDGALAFVENFPGMRTNDLAPLDKKALARFAEVLAGDADMQQRMAKALLSKSLPVARASRYLILRVDSFDLVNLLPAMREFDVRMVRQNAIVESMARTFAPRPAKEAAKFIADFVDTRGWPISRDDYEFLSRVARLLGRSSVPAAVSDHIQSLAPRYAAIWNREIQAASKDVAAAQGSGKQSRKGRSRRRDTPTGELHPVDRAGMSDQSLFDALLSPDEGVRRSACETVASIAQFSMVEFLSYARTERTKCGRKLSGLDNEKFRDALTAVARHVDDEALDSIAEWPATSWSEWELFNPIWQAHATAVGLDRSLSTLRRMEGRAPRVADRMAGEFHNALVLRDQTLRLGLGGMWRDRRAMDPAPDLGFVRPLGGDGTEFGDRPGIDIEEHRKSPYAPDATWFLGNGDNREIVDPMAVEDLAPVLSLLHGDGNFDRLERQIWPEVATRIATRCCSDPPDSEWLSALGIFLLCSPAPDPLVLERYAEAAPFFRSKRRLRSHLFASNLLARYPIQKEWWLPYFRRDLEIYAAETLERRSDEGSPFYFHDLPFVLQPHLLHSQLFGTDAFVRAVNSLLDLLPGATMAEKLMTAQFEGDFGIMGAAECIATEDESAELLSVLSPSMPHAKLAWRLRESRPAAVREFLERWDSVGSWGYWRTLQSDALHLLVDMEPYAKIAADRLASSLASHDNEEFSWAFGIVFVQPSRLSPSGADFLELVVPRIFGARKKNALVDAINRTILLGRYGRAPKERVFAALEDAFELDDPTAWRKAADAMREFRKELPHLALANRDRVRELVARDPKKRGPIFKGLV